MAANQSIRLGTIVATLFTSFVAPLTVSIVSNAIKAETTMQLRPIQPPALAPVRSQPTVVLLPPLAAPTGVSTAPGFRRSDLSARPTNVARN